ncbi:MAG TPA: lysylphosphatidylglycerol synthase domain-containing protein [Gemmatimonadales bacterium]|nr:lysylphosphatidylglycerol synthase domain-containing protein [Gemmatimonadales bacterium]
MASSPSSPAELQSSKRAAGSPATTAASPAARRRRILGAVLGLILFGGAIYVLYAELRQHSFEEILAELRAFPRIRLLLSLAATVLGYLALIGYDAVSLTYLGRRLPFRCVAYAAFVGYAFANSLPLSVLTGASVRYRLYAQWGLGRGEAARVITLNTVTYVVGLLATAGLAFVAQPVLVPGFLRLPLRSARPFGALCLVLVIAYLIWSTRRDGPLKIWRWTLPRPTFLRAVAQIGVSAADWVLSGAAFYVLLPHAVPFHVFFALFLLGQIASLVAQVPAGLGVFEAVMLWALQPAIGAPAIVAALLGYRIVYFLLPLVIATLMWGGRETREWVRRRRARATAPQRATAR